MRYPGIRGIGDVQNKCLKITLIIIKKTLSMFFLYRSTLVRILYIKPNNLIMLYGIILGSNLFIGTNGVLSYKEGNKIIPFFRIREIFRERSPGSYLAVDCDIIDNSGNREVKLAKSKPVVGSEHISVTCERGETTVIRNDGSLVIKIEQIDNEAANLPSQGPVAEFLEHNELDAIIRITGDFNAGSIPISVDTDRVLVGSITIGGNLSIGSGGITISKNGISL